MRYSGKYEVISHLGRGSMGTVFKVRHVVLETVLALKVLPAHLTENEDVVKRFYREARVMARMNHPNIARVVDVQKDEDLGLHYFIMEFIDGQTLRDFSRERGALSSIEVLSIARAVAKALDYAHKFNPPVIHRDVKPTNIMVELPSKRVVVMDFGIAKELDESEVTRAGTILGTLKYSPPEQIRHDHLDGAADVYALGMVMYELLVGRHLLTGLNEHELVRRILDPKEFQPEFPPAVLPHLAEIIVKAIAKNRSVRYRCMEDLIRDLDACWVSLDEDQTTVVNATRYTDFDSADAVEAIESQIQKLSEEREERLLARLSSQVTNAREAADKEGASQSAATLYQSAAKHEQDAQSALRNHEKENARTKLTDALALYQEARDKAIVSKVVELASRAREQSKAAREEADRYAAELRAATYYNRALDLHNQADKLWTGASYREACELYDEACSLFEASQERAFQALLAEDAGMAKKEAQAARARASAQNVEQLAQTLFTAALDTEHRAQFALEQEEFTQARELFSEAQRRFEAAIDAAAQQLEQLRAQAQASDQAAALAREQAEEAGSQDTDEFKQAIAAQAKAAASIAAGQYEQAAHAYDQAALGFRQIRDRVERDRLEAQLAPLLLRVEEASQSSDFTEIEALFPERHAALSGLRKEASNCHRNGALPAALAGFNEWLSAYDAVHMRLAAHRQQKHSKAIWDALQKLRRTNDPLRKWGQSAWAKVDAIVAEAEAAWQRQDHERLQTCGGQADAAFQIAVAEAETEQGVAEAAETMHTQAVAARSEADAAQGRELAEQSYTQALHELVQGEQHLARHLWAEAKTCFTHALHEFRDCAKSALRRAAELQMEQARHHAEAERDKIITLDPAQRAAALYSGASELMSNAETSAAAQDFAGASGCFQQAQQKFQEAGRQAFKRLAEECRDEAVFWRQDLRAQGFRDRSLRPATQLLDKGEKLLGKGQSEQARKLFQEATATYQKLLREKPAPAPAPEPLPVSKQHKTFIALIAAGLGGFAFAYWYLSREFSAKDQATVTPSAQPHQMELKFSRWSPEAPELAVAKGQTQEFSVQVERADPAAGLRYEWFVDGVKFTAGPSWRYQVETAVTAPSQRTIKAVVTQNNGQQIERSWKLRIISSNHAPQLAEVQPSTPNLALRPGAEQSFRVLAKDADAGDAVTYRWFEDDKPVAESPEWHFRSLQPGVHHIVAEARDREGLAVRSSWEVSVNLPPKEPVRLELVTVTPATDGTTPLTLKSGQTEHFQANARSNSAEPITYGWYLNGELQGQGNTWTLHPDPKLSNATQLEIKLSVSTSEGQKQERIWNVQVLPASKPVQIVQSSPRPGAVAIEKGDHKRFTIEAREASDNSPPVPKWSLDGQAVATGPEWELDTATQSTGNHRLEVSVTGADGTKVSREWNVAVTEPEVAPTIASSIPGERLLNAAPNAELTFGLTAQSTKADNLKYQWSLDGKTIARHSESQFRMNTGTLAAGQHELTAVAIAPKGLRSAPQQWTIVVPEPTEPPTATAAPTSPPAPVQITHAEVNSWLANYVSAWKRKDIDALVNLKEVSRANAGRLQTVLANYQSFDVELEGVDISLSEDTAKVSFRRVDIIDGKRLPQPDRKTVSLKRHDDGALVRSQ